MVNRIHSCLHSKFCGNQKIHFDSTQEALNTNTCNTHSFDYSTASSVLNHSTYPSKQDLAETLEEIN